MDIISKQRAEHRTTPRPLQFRTLPCRPETSAPLLHEGDMNKGRLFWALAVKDRLSTEPLPWQVKFLWAESFLTSARAKPRSCSTELKHGQYLITDTPRGVFCSLTLPGILMMLFRLHFLFFICIS